MIDLKKVLPTVGVACALMAGSATQGAVIAAWDFNGEGPTSATMGNESYLASAGGQSGSALMALAGPTTGTNLVIESNGTLLNALDGVPAGDNLRLQRGIRWNNGTMTLSFDATGLTDIKLTFAAQTFSGGVNAFQASYSTDGVDFFDFGTVQSIPAGSYGLVTVDPGTVLDGASTASIRLTFEGATGAASNTGARAVFDNVVITAIPEPASLALLGLGGLILVGRRRNA